MINKNTNFLVADDDPDDQELFIDAVKEMDDNFVCVTAMNGRDALHKLLGRPLHLPDLIFLDLNMPLMNGKECLAEIKKNSILQKIPVIIYSTSADKKDIVETMQLGAAFFLQKPDRYEELSRALWQIVYHDWKHADQFTS